MTKKKPQGSLIGYAGLLKEVKSRIRHAQSRAVFAANAELIRLYWDLGRMIDARQNEAGWGAGVIPRLAQDLRNELPEVKGFSERNIGLMISFFRAYPQPQAILQQPVAKMELDDSPLWSIPWGHHAILLAKVRDLDHRVWYMRQTLQHGWSRNILFLQTGSKTHARQGQAITNAPAVLPSPQSDLVVQTLKDPYIFDFLTLEEPFHERELETQLLRHLERFLLELGTGFAFVGRQYRVKVGDEDFYIDLLFYHLKLRCYVVIDLKKGAFEAAYVGKMNFYLNVVDDRLRHETDARSIGLIRHFSPIPTVGTSLGIISKGVRVASARQSGQKGVNSCNDGSATARPLRSSPREHFTPPARPGQRRHATTQDPAPLPTTRPQEGPLPPLRATRTPQGLPPTHRPLPRLQGHPPPPHHHRRVARHLRLLRHLPDPGRGRRAQGQYANAVREAVLDRLPEDRMTLAQIQKALRRDFFLELSDGFLYDCLDWKVRQCDGAAYRRWTLAHFSGTLCVDEIHLGPHTLLLATDPLNDFPVAFALVTTNDQPHLGRFPGQLRDHGLVPRVVVTDGSPLYPSLLAELWPQAEHQLCVFHVPRDLNAEVLKAVRRIGRALVRRGARGRPRKRGPVSKRTRPRRRRASRAKYKGKAHRIIKKSYLIVKRRDRVLRLYEKARYKWRTARSKVRFVCLLIERRWGEKVRRWQGGGSAAESGARAASEAQHLGFERLDPQQRVA